MGKDLLRDFLETVRRHGAAAGNLRGLLHVLVGRRITRTDGTLVSQGLSWRALAVELKKLRWDREAVRELGLDPRNLPLRERIRFWNAAIALAGLDTPEAAAAADRLVTPCRTLGYVIGPAPHTKA